MDSKLKCSFEMPTVEQLLESKNIHDDTTVNYFDYSSLIKLITAKYFLNRLY